VTVEPVDFSLSYEQPAGREVALITLAGELDLRSVAQFERMLARATGLAGGLALDMTALRFMDSSGLRVVLRSSAHLQAVGRRVAIAVVEASPVRSLFSLAGVQDRLCLFPTREEAVAFAREGAE
jgi:anti-sigma B factor antagonist